MIFPSVGSRALIMSLSSFMAAVTVTVAVTQPRQENRQNVVQIKNCFKCSQMIDFKILATTDSFETDQLLSNLDHHLPAMADQEQISRLWVQHSSPMTNLKSVNQQQYLLCVSKKKKKKWVQSYQGLHSF